MDRARVLRLAGAVLVLAGGAIHLKLNLDDYGNDDILMAFALNAAASALVAAYLVLRDDLIGPLAGLALSLGSLGAFAMSRRGDGILGFREVGWNPSPEAAVTVIVELAAVVVLAAIVGAGARPPHARLGDPCRCPESTAWNQSVVVDLGTGVVAPEVEPPEGPDLRFGFNAHEWGVLLPLSLIGFFLNYDTGLLSLAAPAIAEGLDVSVARFGIGVAIIRLAALGSMPVLRFADRVGRRRMLLISVLAFTVATAATSLAWGLVSFVVFQMVARLFLATEESLGGIVISEEVRPDRRGAGLTLLGIIAMTGFGLVAIMLLVVPLTPLDWRILYLAALPPLLLVAWLRRNLRETKAFTVAQAEDRVQGTFWPRVDRAHRPYLWRITVVLGTHGLLATPMFFYAAELAQDGYGWEGLFTVIVIAAGPATLLGYVAGGRLSDRVGRKPIVLWSSLIVILGVLLVFSEERWLFAPGSSCSPAPTRAWRRSGRRTCRRCSPPRCAPRSSPSCSR